MAIKRLTSRTGLQGFKVWLAEHFPGRRLEVVHSREGDEHLCSLKLRGVLIATGRGSSQKSADDEAAAQAHERCKGDPGVLRDILRTRDSRESLPTVSEGPGPQQAGQAPDLTETRKLRKQLAEQSKSLDEFSKQIEVQSRDIKRLKREMAEFSNQSLGSRLEQLGTEVARLRGALETVVAQNPESRWQAVVSASAEQAQQIAHLEAKLCSAAESIEICLSRLSRSSVSQTPASPVAIADLVTSLKSWAPDFCPMAGPILTALIACKIVVLPSLAIARACHQAFSPFAELAVFYVEPDWVSSRQALSPELLQLMKSASEQPKSLHLVVFEGVGRSGLHTWARPLLHWAQGLQASIPDFLQQPWPRNLRVMFVPAPQALLALDPVVAALPARPEPCSDGPDRLDWQSFLDTRWDAQAVEPLSTRGRIQILVPSGDAWTDNLLIRWPETYREAEWWVV